jgi:hypothetical protein
MKIKMKKLFLLTVFSFGFILCSAQYFVFDSIPENLKTRADAVVRSEQCLFSINGPGKAVKKVRKAITLMNENSEDYRLVSVLYDKSSKVNYLRGTVFDEKGNIVKVLGAKDVYDISAMQSGTFYSDDRMKIIYFPLYKFPYTIEYEYEISYSSLLNYLGWSFQDSPDISVQKSGIQFIVPENLKLRYYEKYVNHNVDSVIADNKKIYTWQEENLPAYHSQDISVKPVYRTPYVYTAPLVFEYSGLKGSMKTWKDLGSWFYQINDNRDFLTMEEADAVKKLVSEINDPVEKIKKVYEYVQAKTRYVSIQIGIGGYRTAEASAVSKNGFGDCKALVNYTHALLSVLGINSIFALVKADDFEDINKTFVSNQFNHVILCVPMPKDSIWLECTSKTSPAGFLSFSTAGKNVLLLTSEGGKLVKTPDFRKETSLFTRTGSLYLNIFGTASGKLKNHYKGFYFGYVNGNYSFQSEDEIRKDINSNLRFSDCSITTANYSEKKYPDPSAELVYDLSIKNFGSLNGQRIYFTPGIAVHDYLEKTATAFEIPVSQVTKDSMIYVLPLNFKVDFLPENVSIVNEFGKFNYSLDIEKDKILFRRTLELNKMYVEIEKFNEFRKFINAIATTERKKIILVRSEGT